MWGHVPEWISVASLLIVLSYTRASPHTPEVPSRLTLLSALGKALGYMTENHQQMDIDGYFGVAIAQGQLETMKPLNECALRNPRRKANYLIKIARNTNFPKNIGRVAKGVLEAGRWGAVGKHLNKTLQCKIEAKHSRGVYAKTCSRNSPNERESDFCLSQLMEQMEGVTSVNIGSSCKISQQCRLILTSGYSWGYSLTHRIIYNLVSQAMGCNGNIPVEEYCCKIMDEVRDVQASGYPEPWRDLFLEQILVCSLSGFGQFLQNDWLQLVLDWQRNPGCWGWGSTRRQNSPNLPKNNQKFFETISRMRDYRPPAKLWDNSFKADEFLLRFKRSSRSIGPSDCSTHTSGLGVALLALAARHRRCSEIDRIIYC